MREVEFRNAIYGATLTGLVNIAMSHPMSFIPSDKSYAFRCGYCDVEIARFQRRTYFRMEMLSKYVLGHIQVCPRIQELKRNA